MRAQGLSAGPAGNLPLAPTAVNGQRAPGSRGQCGALWQRTDDEVYDSGHQFVHALVCRRWLRVARQAVTHVSLKKLQEVPALRIVSELARLPRVSHLNVPFSRSLPSLTPRFWSALPASLRNLRVLQLGSPGGPGERAQTQALHLIFSSCPLLEVLEVKNMEYVREVPESLGCATRLVHLALCKRPSLGSFIIASLPDSVGRLKRLQVLSGPWTEEVRYRAARVLTETPLYSRALHLYSTGLVTGSPAGLGGAAPVPAGDRVLSTC